MKAGLKILIINSDESFRRSAAELLGVFNQVSAVGDSIRARPLLAKNVWDVIVIDVLPPDGMPERAGSVLVTTESIASVQDLLSLIPAAIARTTTETRPAGLQERARDAFRYELVGHSASTVELRETVLGLVGTNATTLITGESGTGKELIARRLHAVEGDARRPFIAVNCGAIAESLIESELFGHKKGAFTGAIADRAGKIELADGGDLFLDEIGELPPLAQTKLLRALQEGEVTRVGDHRVLRVRCRFIAATNQDLERMVREKKFREDLYHRLNVIRIATTPLRARAEDIPELARGFALQLGGPNFRVSPEVLRGLANDPWPGNIRELRNTIERAVISARRRKTSEIEEQDIGTRGSPLLGGATVAVPRGRALPASFEELSAESFRQFLEGTQKEYFAAALALSGGKAETLAAALGLGRSTVFKRLRELGIGRRGP